jgi:hypothetical protein
MICNDFLVSFQPAASLKHPAYPRILCPDRLREHGTAAQQQAAPKHKLWQAPAVQERQQTKRPITGTLRNLVSLRLGAPQHFRGSGPKTLVRPYVDSQPSRHVKMAAYRTEFWR